MSNRTLINQSVSQSISLIYIFIRQKGSRNKWKNHQTHNNKKTNKKEKTMLKAGELVNSVTTFIYLQTLKHL